MISVFFSSFFICCLFLGACHYHYPQQKERSKLHTIQNQMEKIYRVVVFGIQGDKKTIDLCSTTAEFNRLTLKDLKEKIVQTFPGYDGKTNRAKCCNHLKFLHQAVTLYFSTFFHKQPDLFITIHRVLCKYRKSKISFENVKYIIQHVWINM